jgi:hypothetical protein
VTHLLLPRSAALCLVLAALAVHAQPAPPASGTPPGPPPEAVKACEGKAAGAQASFTGRDGRSFSGVCESQNGVLALRPPKGAGGPPPQN